MSSAKMQFNKQAADYWPSLSELERLFHDFYAHRQVMPTCVYLNTRDLGILLKNVFKVPAFQVLQGGKQYVLHYVSEHGVMAIYPSKTLVPGIVEIDSEEFDEEFEKIVLGTET